VTNASTIHAEAILPAPFAFLLLDFPTRIEFIGVGFLLLLGLRRRIARRTLAGSLVTGLLIAGRVTGSVIAGRFTLLSTLLLLLTGPG
jgi:hypothetical protein